MVNIGKSVIIKGELSGSEDLTIEGQVEGKIELKQNVLTIGPNGKIKAQILAKAVVVQGEVTGNISATERVDIRDAGRSMAICRPRAWRSPMARTSAAASTCRRPVESRRSIVQLTPRRPTCGRPRRPPRRLCSRRASRRPRPGSCARAPARRRGPRVGSLQLG